MSSMHAELEIWPSDWRGRQIGKSDLSSPTKLEFLLRVELMLAWP